MTSKDIQDYIEIDLGKDMRHDPCMLLEATQETADTFELDELYNEYFEDNDEEATA